MEIKIRAAQKDRSVVNGLKLHNDELRFSAFTVSKDGKALPREKEVFIIKGKASSPNHSITGPLSTPLNQPNKQLVMV